MAKKLKTSRPIELIYRWIPISSSNLTLFTLLLLLLPLQQPDSSSSWYLTARRGTYRTVVHFGK